MNQLVQSAVAAAGQGNKPKAIDMLIQALKAAPGDIDAWLALADLTDDPKYKRQCLNRALSLNPAHPLAREKMLQMDRLAMGGKELSPLGTSVSSQATSSPSAFMAPEQLRSQDLSMAASPKIKPLSFRMPLLTRLSFYVITALGLYMALTTFLNREWDLTLIFLVAFIAMGIFSVIFSFRVDVSETGLLVDRIFTQSRIGWDEIRELKSGSFQHGLELKPKDGKSVKVSGAVSDYSKIVEILRQKRPDLFGMGSGRGDPSSFSFTETRVFKKSLLMQYSGLIIGIPMLIFSALAVLNGYSEYFFVGLFLGGYSIYLIFQPFFHASQIKVEPNRLVFETFFGEKEFTASQIEKIWIKTVRGKYGSAFQYVMVKPMQGWTLSLRGFGVGEEILYGILMNWWSSNNSKLGIH